ncbi:MAG: prepilin-type N-terminal cleavage/methylation domain-containing protein [Candidatus Muirbacterium halophilum]|nr:prepilin-type N-terminal cleavage/methylation domain-containing protein [Candidatus Muirbacterium halophilum]MCK9476834.1 prepilin-type N-terminal cleavage/methylation domain-containing protein [Candidatus Muirbacterium halophilum]
MEFKIRYLRGFSLIEVVATVALLGMVAVPFLNIFLSGNKMSGESKEDLVAINLAREKIEQITLTIFENLEEDYYIFRDIYKDTIHQEFKDADENRAKFYEVYSDVWTEERKENFPRVYNRFISILENRGPIRTYNSYSDFFNDFRRYTVVEDYNSDKKSVSIKKITVYVFNLKTEKEYKLSTLITDYK